jgi:hypothetical protein
VSVHATNPRIGAGQLFAIVSICCFVGARSNPMYAPAALPKLSRLSEP